MNSTEVVFSVALINGNSTKKSIQRAVVISKFIQFQKSYLGLEKVDFYQIDKTNLQTVSYLNSF
jgi:hypothetical protein